MRKDIPGYEGLYAIEDDGKVWSYKRGMYRKAGDVNGYKQVILYKEGVQKHFYIHRLVAEAFIPNPDNLPQINHKDENKANNNVDNLEWCDNKYNMNYGSWPEKRGKQRIYCIETGEFYESQLAAANALDLQQGNIGAVLRGTQKQTGGYHFKFAEDVENEKVEASNLDQ